MEGIIFDIQKFCINDGPGIRTTVFLKGCPLDCKWCHNPESKKREIQLSYKKDKCIGCRKCEFICEQKVHKIKNGIHYVDYNKCIKCGKCLENCPVEALNFYGKKQTTQSIINQVKKDKTYYDESGGGLTISGGEPMMQSEFAIDIAKEARKNGINVVLETSGAGKLEDYKEISKYVDLFLFDYKATGNNLHTELVGVKEDYISDSRNYLLSLGNKIILRCPLIPTQNLTQNHLEAIAQIANSNKDIIGVEILPYHSLGESKSENIGVEYILQDIEILKEQDVEKIINKLKYLGIKNVRRG